MLFVGIDGGGFFIVTAFRGTVNGSGGYGFKSEVKKKQKSSSLMIILQCYCYAIYCPSPGRYTVHRAPFPRQGEFGSRYIE